MTTKPKKRPVRKVVRKAKTQPSGYGIDRLLVVRTASPDGKSQNNFRWPTEGAVECPDWDSNYRRDCGDGLHGLPWAHGDGGLLNWEQNARWLIVEVDLAAGCVGSSGKCRFRRGVVLFCGERYDALKFIAAQGASGPCIGATATAGTRGTATAGDAGTATAGDAGTATAGYAGTATAGYAGTATAGDAGTATAGEYGVISILFYESARGFYRRKVAEVDGKDIKPNVPYVVVDGKLVPKDSVKP